jgi:hypothetical protein
MFLRLGIALAAMTVTVAILPGQVLTASRADVTLNIQNVTQRQVEDMTQKAVARDYAAAWRALAVALNQNWNCGTSPTYKFRCWMAIRCCTQKM